MLNTYMENLNKVHERFLKNVNQRYGQKKETVEALDEKGFNITYIGQAEKGENHGKDIT